MLQKVNRCKTLYYIERQRGEKEMALTASVTFRTTPELKARVEELAKKTKRSTGFYYNAIVEEHIEDLEVLYDVVHTSERVKSGEEPTISLEELMAKYGI